MGDIYGASGDEMGEVLEECNDDLDETDDVNFRAGRDLPGSLSDMSFLTACGLSAPKNQKICSIFRDPKVNTHEPSYDLKSKERCFPRLFKIR